MDGKGFYVIKSLAYTLNSIYSQQLRFWTQEYHFFLSVFEHSTVTWI